MLTAWMLYSMGVTALVALGALAAEGAARALGRPTRWGWLGAILVSPFLMALPLISARMSSGTPRGGEAAGAAVSSGAGEGAVSGVGWALPSVQVPAESWLMALDLPLLLLWIIATGASVGALGLAARKLHERLQACEEALTDGRTVLLSERTGPAVVGFVRTRIVLPRWVLALDVSLRSLILDHEEEHRRARDPGFILLASLPVLFLPWNLPLWWCFDRFRAAVEIDCDDRVLLKHPEERHRYGILLIELGRRGRPLHPPVPAFARRNALSATRRIEMLVRTPPPNPARRAFLLTGVSVLLLVGACLVPGPEEERTGILDVDGPSRAELGAEPQFTPFHQAPEVRNRGEVAEVLDQEYPALLRAAGIGGTAIVHFFLTENGQVGNVKLAESSGHAPLDQAALRVATTFDFSPAQYEGQPTPVWIQIPLTFVAEDEVEGR